MTKKETEEKRSEKPPKIVSWKGEAQKLQKELDETQDELTKCLAETEHYKHQATTLQTAFSRQSEENVTLKTIILGQAASLYTPPQSIQNESKK